MTTRVVRVLVVDDKPAEDVYIHIRRAGEELRWYFELVFTEAKADVKRRIRNERFGVVLVDVQGVDYLWVVRFIARACPGLPIIMVSGVLEVSKMMRCLDLGARNFIDKTELLAVDGLMSDQAEERSAAARRRAAKLISDCAVVSAELRAALERPLESGRLRKRGDKSSVIADQAEFLQYVATTPLHDWFPEVTGGPSVDREYLSYTMPFYDMIPLRLLVFEATQRERCVAQARNVLERVLRFCFARLYHHERKAPWQTIVDDLIFDRYETRLKDALGKLDRLKVGPEADYLRTLLTKDRVLLGGRELIGAGEIVHELGRDAALRSLLRPPWVAVMHGDLHFQNILVERRVGKVGRLKLIDPRGYRRQGYPPGVGDPAYDMGKVLHSCHGYYDFIHAAILRSDWSGNLVFDDTSEVFLSGGSGAGLTARVSAVPEWARSVFDALTELLLNILKERAMEGDPSLLLRSRLYEAIHFCTMIPFHLEGRTIDRAIALQIRGIELINEFYREYRTGCFT
jgi:FixJ family two-component response regulator